MIDLMTHGAGTMQSVITTEAVMAYSQCPLKAYLLLSSADEGTPCEYVTILKEQASANRAQYLSPLKGSEVGVCGYNAEDMKQGSIHLIEVAMESEDLRACCDVLTKVNSSSALGRHSYEPTIVIGTPSATKKQKLELLFAGHVLERILFTFIKADSVPWNNNMSETAIRRLAIQMKISQRFGAGVVPHYLRLLGMGQTCRFQEKSLLEFLLSGEKDIDKFKGRKPVVAGMPVGLL